MHGFGTNWNTEEKQVVYPIHNNKFVNFWLEMPQKPMNDDLFIRYFTVRYQLYKLTNYMEHTPELEETDSIFMPQTSPVPG